MTEEKIQDIVAHLRPGYDPTKYLFKVFEEYRRQAKNDAFEEAAVLVERTSKSPDAPGGAPMCGRYFAQEIRGLKCE